MFGFDAAQFGLDDLEGFIPADSDERLRAALAACARPPPQKAFADVRLIDPQAVPDDAGQPVHQGCRIAIAREGSRVDNGALTVRAHGVHAQCEAV